MVLPSVNNMQISLKEISTPYHTFLILEIYTKHNVNIPFYSKICQRNSSLNSTIFKTYEELYFS